MTEDVYDAATTAENLELARYLQGYGGTQAEEKHNIHKFLHDVVITKDTTKLGNLTKEEVGIPKLPIRTFKELSLFCKDVADMEYFSNYFDQMSEIMTSTSLSKDSKLLDTAVTTTRQVADVTKKRPINKKGLFKKKEDVEI